MDKNTKIKTDSTDKIRVDIILGSHGKEEEIPNVDLDATVKIIKAALIIGLTVKIQESF